MQHSDFVHLHVHTQYSLLDGACLIPNLINKAVEYRMPALAMTDHGNIFGAIEFYGECMEKGIRPIIGCEVYIAPNSRFEKASHGIREASFHLTLLVKDEVGYRNLMKLVSVGYLEGFYYKPRIDKEILSQYAQGLICLSGCLKGELSHLILGGVEKLYLDLVDSFKSIFGHENFYLELMDNNIAEQKKVNEALVRVSRKLGVPFVATNDVHYLVRGDAQAHEALLCIQTQTTLDDPDRMRFQTDEFYFKSDGEMKELFSDLPEAITNTVSIAERCNLELDFSQTYLPHYHPPEGKSRQAYLRQLCEESLIKRYPNADEAVRDRLEHELSIINNAGYTSYFLIAWDFVRYAKENNIPSGPGRGSAAGSLVSYLLGVTDIDPLKYDLIFERFLNPQRVSLPDIDIDFCYERRGEVINYVTQKYGKDNVAQIITFGTMGAKAVVRDVGRVMNMPYAEVDRIAKLIPTDPNITLSGAIRQEPELKNLYQNDPQVTQLLNTSKALEGLTRHASTHAAGVVISEEPLTNYTPLFKTSDDQITTGYSMSALEKIGLLKMDFLGLRTLTVIDETIKIIKRTKNINVEIDKIPLDDPKTYRLLSSAHSLGIFQLESSGMRDLLKKLKPEKFEDIISLLALYRPGPIGSGMVDDFITRKHGEVTISYDDKRLESILEPTYGIIVFQEQVMKIVNELAGFSLSQADLLRRAISKKTPGVMEEQRKEFIEGAVKNGVDRGVASKIFSQIEYFAGYGFNRSHSAAYGLISYRTAYLKANFPLEFMTALLTSEKDNTDKIVSYINEAARMGIKILPPDVNESFANFTAVGTDAIRFGLGAVKNVGQGAIDSIIEARGEYGRFKSLYEFCEHIDLRLVNRKVIESLIKCGVFDSQRVHRSQLMAILDRALESAGGIQKDRLNGQLSFFDAFEHSEGFKKTFQEIPRIKEWPENQLLSFEKEMLGFYITRHPLVRYEKLLKTYASSSSVDLTHYRDGDRVSIGGIISRLKQTTTKRTNEKMAIVGLEDLRGTIEVLIFPRVFSRVAQFVKMSSLIFVKGRVNLRDEEPKIIADDLIPLEEVRQRYTSTIKINLFTPGLEESTLLQLKEIFSRHQGKVPVYLKFITQPLPNYPHHEMRPKGHTYPKGHTQVLVNQNFFVRPDEELISEVEELLGEDTITVDFS